MDLPKSKLYKNPNTIKEKPHNSHNNVNPSLSAHSCLQTSSTNSCNRSQQSKSSTSLEAQVHLHVHCKDKKHGIPEESVPYKQSFKFQVTNSFWGVTDYYCSFVFLEKVHRFDIYVQNRDLEKCWANCTWTIKEGGPCLIHSVGQTFVDCYEWNKM